MAAVQQGAPLLPSLHFVDWAEHGGVELLPAWRCRQSRIQSPTGQHTERFWDPKVLYREPGAALGEWITTSIYCFPEWAHPQPRGGGPQTLWSLQVRTDEKESGSWEL